MVARSVMLRCLSLLWLGVMALAPSTGWGATQRILYFYPDANHQAIIRLTAQFNDYLAAKDLKLVFQPVESLAQFEKLLAEPETVFAVVASFYLSGSEKVPCEPFLVPASGGSPFYSKVLVDVGMGEPGDLKGKAVAATVLASNTDLALKDTFEVLRKGSLKVDGARGIPVSKDIDALLALTFGQVQAALVTPDSIEVLKKINPAAPKFRVVFKTEPILRPPLCEVAKRASAKEKAKLTSTLLEMSKDELGQKTIKAMGFENWATFEPGMLKR